MLGVLLGFASRRLFWLWAVVVGGSAKRVRRFRRKLLIAGEPRWVDVEEFESSDPVVVDGMPADHFSQIAAAALKAGAGRYGSVGAADAYLFESQPLHRIAVDWLEQWQLDH